MNNQQPSTFSLGNNINNGQTKFSLSNYKLANCLPLSTNTARFPTMASPIIKIMRALDDIQHPIKNKYVQVDELTNFIEKTEKILKMAIDSRNFLLTNTQPSLDVIFPAMDHLKLFITDADMGAIALVSKNLYNLMFSHYGESNVDIFITKHYIDNDAYDYSVDVNYNTMVPKDINKNNHIQQYGELPKDSFHFIPDTYIEGKMSLKVKIIALKKLRKLIGPELYYSEYKIVFFKDDIIYLYLKYNEEKIPYNSKVCMFCYRSCCRNHEYCYQSFATEQKNEVIFNDHIKNGTHDKEFKYFLHHLNTNNFTPSMFKDNNCKFCNSPNDEICNVVYQNINCKNDYPLKALYKYQFDMYHSQQKLKNWSLAQGQVDKMNGEEVKYYSFCINPEYEYIYGQSEILDK